jgi:hypothetical protein
MQGRKHTSDERARGKLREQKQSGRGESREQRAENREQRAKTERERREQKQSGRGESREQRAESREERGESKEQRAESREQCERITTWGSARLCNSPPAPGHTYSWVKHSVSNRSSTSATVRE